MNYEVVRNERIEEREDRTGRIRSRRVLTWDVVRDGTFYRECRTRKEAKREADELNRTFQRQDGRKAVTCVRSPRTTIAR